MKTLTSPFALLLSAALLWPWMASCSAPFPEGDLFNLVLLQKTTEPTAPSCAGSACYLFVTKTAYQPGVGFTGVSGADAVCQTEKKNNFPNLPDNNYRAMLVDQIPSRTACNTANCIGDTVWNPTWVLHPNTYYRRATDGSLVMLTNDKGISSFPLYNTMDTTGTAPYVWTGLYQDWTKGPTPATCNSWTNTGLGNTGNTGITDPTSIYDSLFIDSCGLSHPIICVQY